jgi:hypothetical protein
MRGFFDKVACVIAGRARDTIAGGRSRKHLFPLERFTLCIFLSCQTCPMGRLFRYCAAFLNIVLRRTSRFGGLPDLYSFYCVTCDEWQLHRPSAAEATWRFRRDLLVYLSSMTRSPTKPSFLTNVVREHYSRVAGSLTFGRTSR